MLPIARVRRTWSSTPSALQESKTCSWCPPLQKRKDGAASVVVISGAEAAKVGQPPVIVRATSSHGFHDVVTGHHMGASDENFSVYRWNGAKYKEVDCYEAASHPPKLVITDCSQVSSAPPAGAEAIAVAADDDSSNHRVKVDELGPDNDPQFVRSIEGAWSKPTLLYSDDNVKVYMPFNDQLALGASFPERNWSNSSFEVLLYSSKGRMPSAKWAANWAAGRETYIEERVSIDTAKLTFTPVERKFMDSSGMVSATTPHGWRGDSRDLRGSQWPTSRSITDEVVQRLTEPQRIGLKALNVRSLDELVRDSQLHQQYLTLMKDQTQMQRGLGPEHSQK